MTIRITRIRFPVYLYVLFFALAVYAVHDLLTTANVGLRGADRSSVHSSVLAIIVILSLYLLSTLLRAFTITPIMLSLLAVFLWCSLVDASRNGLDWLSVARLGLAALWLLIYHFFRTYLLRCPGALRHVEVGVLCFFLFYLGAATYAAVAISATYDEIAVVNMVYNVLVFLPWLFLFERKRLRLLGIGAACFVVALSMKRGAIAVFPLMILLPLLVEARMARPRYSHMVRIVAFAAILFLCLYVANRCTDGFLLERFAYDQLIDGRGRQEIYSRALDAISNRSSLDFLIGSGTAYAMAFNGGSAHNDWIEFLFSYGLVGALLYAAFICLLLTRLWALIARKSRLAAGFCSAVVYVFIVGLYGMVYFSHATLFIMAFLGAADGLSGKRPNVTAFRHARSERERMV
jgi:O-antigen ligase